MSLAKALVAFQAEAPALPLDGVNPHYGNRFTTLDALVTSVRPVLAKHGLSFVQLPTHYDGQPALRTVLLHESGDKLEDVMLLKEAKPDPQGQGSALTYARRYALAAALGLVADEDDDGNATKVSGGTDGASKVSVPQAGLAAAEPASPASQFVAPPPREQPTDGGDPVKVVVTFGKHKGSELGTLPIDYVEWIATKFDAKNAEQRRIVACAKEIVGLNALPLDGGGINPDDSIPFGPVIL